MSSRRPRSPVHPNSAFVATLGVGALGVLVFALTHRQQLIREVASEPPPVSAAAHWDETFSARLEAVTRRLENGPIRLPHPTLQPRTRPLPYTLRQYELVVAPDAADAVRALLEQARGEDATVTYALAEQADGLRAEVGVDGLRTHELRVRWGTEDRRRAARVAVVIDDLGNNLLLARQLISIDLPLAMAVMPFRPFSRQVAELAHLSGREVLLHLPMEAESGESHGEDVVLLVADGPDRLRQEIDESLADVPHAIGVNNHMGSRFTRDRRRMATLLAILRQHQLFFVDSMTSLGSVGGEVAAAMGVPALTRDVFLDDPSGGASVPQQLNRLLDIATARGTAVGIGHPRRVTMAALQEFAAMARARGVAVVPVSELLGR